MLLFIVCSTTDQSHYLFALLCQSKYLAQTPSCTSLLLSFNAVYLNPNSSYISTHLKVSLSLFCTYLRAGSSFCTLTAVIIHSGQSRAARKASHRRTKWPDAQSHFHKQNTAGTSVTMTDRAVNGFWTILSNAQSILLLLVEKHRVTFRYHSWIYSSISILIS